MGIENLFVVEPGDEWVGTEAFLRSRALVQSTPDGSETLDSYAHTSRLGIVSVDLGRAIAETTVIKPRPAY